MKAVISGASGLIGRRLVADLESAGSRIVRLVREFGSTEREGTAPWNPTTGELDPAVLAGADVVINLNGRNVGEGRWTSAVKDELRSSRLQPTRTLVDAIGRAHPPPKLLINASAIGYYGDRGEETLDESSAPGSGFLAELSSAWEEAAVAAQSADTRVVILRLGMVVGRGGALAKMLTPFKLGLGGPFGSGKQWWSWVAMEDVIGATRFTIARPEVTGPLNVVSPQPLRCRDFARTLGRVLRRPAVLPMPAPMARLAIGEMADALLLASAKVRPAALERLGFSFRVPSLDQAIRQALEDLERGLGAAGE
jgi:uncharacterized protein (TIGR01777 family)